MVSVVETILETVSRTPDAVAVRWLDSNHTLRHYSYRELWQIANRMAQSLRQFFPKSSEGTIIKVGVMIDEGAMLPLGELAVLLSSPQAALVPMDPMDPRLHFLIEDAEPVVVIVKDDVCLLYTSPSPRD
eukprot:TRINITY_DN13277_c0_g1_i1.p1 TRINITY_DN13277_c0_g1~~TRINITY_DN13277_c0_g1_i1.p1  ORF type:complete len:143 (+),score=20.27 TRINITY_DN13277_c0_g1_i1:40-429(+)